VYEYIVCGLRGFCPIWVGGMNRVEDRAKRRAGSIITTVP
jgi:hypothetical protein